MAKKLNLKEFRNLIKQVIKEEINKNEKKVFIPSEEKQIELSQTKESIKLLKHLRELGITPSETVQINAVKQYPLNVVLIDNPSEKVQMETIKNMLPRYKSNFGYVLNHISKNIKDNVAFEVMKIIPAMEGLGFFVRSSSLKELGITENYLKPIEFLINMPPNYVPSEKIKSFIKSKFGVTYENVMKKIDIAHEESRKEEEEHENDGLNSNSDKGRYKSSNWDDYEIDDIG
jgi:hypothetical protein